MNRHDVNCPLILELDELLLSARPDWVNRLKGARIFITGGTGIIGRWLLESLCWAYERHGWRGEVTALTRNAARFCEEFPVLAHSPWLTLQEGDVCSFLFPRLVFTHFLHLASLPDKTSITPGEHRSVFETSVSGTARVLELANKCRCTGFLFSSSAAVYGTLTDLHSPIPEEYAMAPDSMDIKKSYGIGKRTAEYLCALAAAEQRVPATVARIFTVAGPNMPVGRGFALSQFLRMALDKKPINLVGNGQAIRTYLYATDVVNWLWTILLDGRPGTAYNVGGACPLTIRDVANLIASSFVPSPEVFVNVANILNEPSSYMVPDTTRAKEELGLRCFVDFPTVIQRMKYNYESEL